MHPSGRNRFQFAKHIRQAMRCAQANEQMHMIGHATDTFGDSPGGSNDSTKVRVQVPAPPLMDHCVVILRPKDEMIMEAQMCGWHIALVLQRPSRGLESFFAGPVLCSTG